MRLALIAFSVVVASAQAAEWSEAERAQVFGHCIVGKVDSDNTPAEVDTASVECACAAKEIVKRMTKRDFFRTDDPEGREFAEFTAIMDSCKI